MNYNEDMNGKWREMRGAVNGCFTRGKLGWNRLDRRTVGIQEASCINLPWALKSTSPRWTLQINQRRGKVVKILIRKVHSPIRSGQPSLYICGETSIWILPKVLGKISQILTKSSNPQNRTWIALKCMDLTPPIYLTMRKLSDLSVALLCKKSNC